MNTSDGSMRLITKPVVPGSGIKTEVGAGQTRMYGLISIKAELVVGYISSGTRQEVMSFMIIKIRLIL